MRSGAGGPCNHCQARASPCWRKGPPDKPILCNACGARWLTKKSLEGYIPSQVRALGAGQARVKAQGGQQKRSVAHQRAGGHKRPRQRQDSHDETYHPSKRTHPTTSSSVVGSKRDSQHPAPAAATVGGMPWLVQAHADSSHSSFTKDPAADERSTLESFKTPLVASGLAVFAGHAAIMQNPGPARGALGGSSAAGGMGASTLALLQAMGHGSAGVAPAAAPALLRRPRKQAKPSMCAVF